METVLKGIISTLGPLKNELLIFSVLGSLLLTYVGRDLKSEPQVWMQVSGVMILFLVALVIIAVISFYFYALMKLPGSTQEMMFSNSAENALIEHNNRLQKKSVAE